MVDQRSHLPTFHWKRGIKSILYRQNLLSFADVFELRALIRHFTFIFCYSNFLILGKTFVIIVKTEISVFIKPKIASKVYEKMFVPETGEALALQFIAHSLFKLPADDVAEIVLYPPPVIYKSWTRHEPYDPALPAIYFESLRLLAKK